MSMKAIRVLIADDSGLVRDMLRAILAPEPDIVIVGEAINGKDACEKVVALKPDLVTMDIEMPVLGGLEAIEKIMAEHPVPILVITAQSSVRTAFAAVSKGALDVIEKPDISIENVQKLLSKIRMLARVDITTHMATMAKRAGGSHRIEKLPEGARSDRSRVVAIASSTGGPQVIYKVLSQLPASFPLPILITQHIALAFTQGMADWLAGGTALKVMVAAHGARIMPGCVYVNPSEHSMRIVGQIITLGEEDPQLVYHPSCDTMLRSVAATFRERAIGLILSGMGNDGVEGMRLLKSAGGITLAQDETSSVVYGMNKMAIEKGHINTVLPMADIAGALMKLAGSS